MAIYEVPAGAATGPVKVLSAAQVAALDARVHSLEEVLVVASLLANVPKFPLDMLDEVLLLADFVVTFEATTQALRRGRSNMNDVYLELTIPSVHELALPTGVTMDRHCVELVVECASHDQGWASQDNHHDGTYDSSYTWSEIAIIKPDAHDDGEASEREIVTANVRAEREFRHHLKHFKDTEGLVQRIALGDTVQLVLRSMYPGWDNTANYGRLRARFGITVSEDAQLMTIHELMQLETRAAMAWPTVPSHCCAQ